MIIFELLLTTYMASVLFEAAENENGLEPYTKTKNNYWLLQIYEMP